MRKENELMISVQRSFWQKSAVSLSQFGVHPEDFSSTLRLAFWMGLIKFVLHVATNAWQAHLGFGYHRDELYYLICGQRLDWGYVDQAPLVAIQARLCLIFFGKSLVGIRLLSSLAGAGSVFLTGLLCWQLGGRRSAQGLAMLCAIVAPVFLALDSFLSMNSFEPLFWLSLIIVILCIQRGAPSSLWLLAGCIAGLGLLNKPSMIFFIVAAITALLLSPQRTILFNRYFLLAVALTLLLVTPYLLWQYQHQWATLQWLRIAKANGKYLKFSFVDFLLAPIDSLLPITLPVWLGGLAWLLIDPHKRGLRWLGICFILFFILMGVLQAKDYYLASIYLVLFASGAVLWSDIFASAMLTKWRLPAFALFEFSASIWILILLPLTIPVVPVSAWNRYLEFSNQSFGRAENFEVSVLPQFFADRFGWEELANEIQRIVATLPPQQVAHLGILCDNYGEASAINFFDARENFPIAISGHNNYYIWGPHGYSGDALLLVTAQTPEQILKTYSSVQVVGHMHHPLSMPYEQKTIYLVHNRVHPLEQDWHSYLFYY